MSGEGFSLPLIARSRVLGRRKIHTMLVSIDCAKAGGLTCTSEAYLRSATVIAGFFTGGALAIRGGWKSARNSAIACGCLLAVIEGVGIGFQRMMAENTRLDVSAWGNVLEMDDTDATSSYHHRLLQQKRNSRRQCWHKRFEPSTSTVLI